MKKVLITLLFFFPIQILLSQSQMGLSELLIKTDYLKVEGKLKLDSIQ